MAARHSTQMQLQLLLIPTTHCIERIDSLRSLNYLCFSPSSFHCVCFPSSSLAISKYCAVVTIQNLIHKWHNSMVEDILLSRLWSEHLHLFIVDRLHECLAIKQFEQNELENSFNEDFANLVK